MHGCICATGILFYLSLPYARSSCTLSSTPLNNNPPQNGKPALTWPPFPKINKAYPQTSIEYIRRLGSIRYVARLDIRSIHTSSLPYPSSPLPSTDVPRPAPGGISECGQSTDHNCQIAGRAEPLFRKCPCAGIRRGIVVSINDFT